MATIPITKRGAEKLKAELHRLKTVDRPGVIAAIAEARAQGDLSENAEYEAAKDRQGFIEGRIQEVESKLSAAQIIDPSTLDAGGRVVFGASVEATTDAPDVVVAPTAATVAVGQDVSFTASATGEGPISFRWRFAKTLPGLDEVFSGVSSFGFGNGSGLSPLSVSSDWVTIVSIYPIN